MILLHTASISWTFLKFSYSSCKSIFLEFLLNLSQSMDWREINRGDQGFYMFSTFFYHQTWVFNTFPSSKSGSANSTQASSCATTSDFVLDGSAHGQRMPSLIHLDSLFGATPQIVTTVLTICYQHGTSSPNKKPKSWATSETCWSSAPAIVNLHWLIQKGEAVQRSQPCETKRWSTTVSSPQVSLEFISKKRSIYLIQHDPTIHIYLFYPTISNRWDMK